MDIRDSLYCSKKCRKTTDKLLKDYYKLKKENELLKEELTNLKNDISRVYNTMISLETINKMELESDVEVI